MTATHAIIPASVAGLDAPVGVVALPGRVTLLVAGVALVLTAADLQRLLYLASDDPGPPDRCSCGRAIADTACDCCPECDPFA